MGTELGKQVATRAKAKVGRVLPADLGGPHVVVLPCDNLTPGAPVQEYDGPANSLYERFLWRLFSKVHVFCRFRMKEGGRVFAVAASLGYFPR